jgi:hypothetical protein
MGFYPPQGIIVKLEGNYSDWTIYDSFVDGYAGDEFLGQDAIINRDETEILLVDHALAKTRKYTIATKTLSDIQTPDYDLYLVTFYVTVGFTQFPLSFKSAYGTYCVILGREIVDFPDMDRLCVFKNGSLLKTFTDSDLGIASGKIRSAAISPKGKYIVVSGYLSAYDAMGWVVLVGS